MRTFKATMLFALLLLAQPALAQSSWETPGGSRVDGKVDMCLNAQGKALPCSDPTALPLQVNATFSATSAAPVVSGATEATHVMKVSAGSLLSLTTSIGAVSGWLMIFDATSAPADGAVTPKFCRYIKSDATGGATSLAWVNPLTFATGISVAFSSTGCFTKTASATAFFSGQVQ